MADSLSGVPSPNQGGAASGLQPPVPLSGIPLGLLGMGLPGGGSASGTQGGGGQQGLSLLDLLSLLQGNPAPATDLSLLAGAGAGGIGNLGQYQGITPSSLGFGAGGFAPNQGFLGAGDPRSAAATSGGAGANNAGLLQALGLATPLLQLFAQNPNANAVQNTQPTASPTITGTPEIPGETSLVTPDTGLAAPRLTPGTTIYGSPEGVALPPVSPEATQSAYVQPSTASPTTEATPTSGGPNALGSAAGAVGLASSLYNTVNAPNATQQGIAAAGTAAQGAQLAHVPGAGAAGSLLSGVSASQNPNATDIGLYTSLLGGPWAPILYGLGDLVGTLAFGNPLTSKYLQSRQGDVDKLRQAFTDVPILGAATSPQDITAAEQILSGLGSWGGGAPLLSFTGNVNTPSSLTATLSPGYLGTSAQQLGQSGQELTQALQGADTYALARQQLSQAATAAGQDFYSYVRANAPQLAPIFQQEDAARGQGASLYGSTFPYGYQLQAAQTPGIGALQNIFNPSPTDITGPTWGFSPSAVNPWENPSGYTELSPGGPTGTLFNLYNQWSPGNPYIGLGWPFYGGAGA